MPTSWVRRARRLWLAGITAGVSVGLTLLSAPAHGDQPVGPLTAGVAEVGQAVKKAVPTQPPVAKAKPVPAAVTKPVAAAVAKAAKPVSASASRAASAAAATANPVLGTAAATAKPVLGTASATAGQVAAATATVPRAAGAGPTAAGAPVIDVDPAAGPGIGIAPRAPSLSAARTVPEAALVAAVRSCPAANPVAAWQAGTVDPAADQRTAGGPDATPRLPGTEDARRGFLSPSGLSTVSVLAVLTVLTVLFVLRLDPAGTRRRRARRM